MTEQEITDRLVAAHSAYVERTQRQPYIGMSISIGSNGSVSAVFYGRDINDHRSVSKKGFREALDALDALIAAIPSAEEQAQRDAAAAIGAAIEKCRAAGYDDDFVNPLMAMSQKISANALTHQEPVA